MKCSKDSGASVVIAFVTILSIIALSVGMWALVGIPGQIREGNEAHAVYVTDSMTDYKVMLQNLHKDDFKNLNVSTIVPVGSSYSSGNMVLNRTSVGTLSYIRNGAETYAVWSQDVNRFTLTVGSGTVIGYEGGGVFRSDGGNYVWSVYPSIYFGKIDNNNHHLGVFAGNISNITGDISIGVSGDISINTRYLDQNVLSSGPVSNNTTTLQYIGEDAGLWYSAFFEAYSRYTYSNEKCDGNLTVNRPQLLYDTVTMGVVSHETGYDITAFLSGYTYDVGLVPDIVVKKGIIAGDIVVNGVVYNYASKVTNQEIIELETQIAEGNTITLILDTVYQIGDNDYLFIIDDHIIHKIGSNELNRYGSIEDYILSTEHDNDFVKINENSVYDSSSIQTIESNKFWIPSNPRKGSLYLSDNGDIYVCTQDIDNQYGATAPPEDDRWHLLNLDEE